MTEKRSSKVHHRAWWHASRRWGRLPRGCMDASITYGAPPGPPLFQDSRQQCGRYYPVNGGVPRLMFTAATGTLGTVQPESRCMGERNHGARAPPSLGKPEGEDCAHEEEMRQKSLNLSYPIYKRSSPVLVRWMPANPPGRTYGQHSGGRVPSFSTLCLSLAILTSSSAQGAFSTPAAPLAFPNQVS